MAKLSISDLTISLLISVFFLSCKDDQSVLEGCCDNPAINTIVGNSNVYVPNIFTPNADGRNDRLAVYGDSIKRIAHMEIRNKDNEVVFMATNIMPGIENVGWDGKVDGNVVDGLYDITIQVETTDGTIEILQGKVCNHPCNDSGSNLLNQTNCQFPSQNDGGAFNPNIPSGEVEDCFE